MEAQASCKSDATFCNEVKIGVRCNAETAIPEIKARIISVASSSMLVKLRLFWKHFTVF